jgi:hypothetical protein
MKLRAWIDEEEVKEGTVRLTSGEWHRLRIQVLDGRGEPIDVGKDVTEAPTFEITGLFGKVARFGQRWAVNEDKTVNFVWRAAGFAKITCRYGVEALTINVAPHTSGCVFRSDPGANSGAIRAPIPI